jgi:hypothetical protein
MNVFWGKFVQKLGIKNLPKNYLAEIVYCKIDSSFQSCQASEV